MPSKNTTKIVITGETPEAAIAEATARFNHLRSSYPLASAEYQNGKARLIGYRLHIQAMHAILMPFIIEIKPVVLSGTLTS